jgi:hypothetical protein
MPEGQGEIQPFQNDDQAVAGVLAALQETPEFAPPPKRDEQGKFAKAQPEPEQAQASEEAQAEEPAEESTEEAQGEEPRKLKLNYRGEEKEFLEPEVIELAQKGYDYTQKTQALAQERAELPNKVKAEVEARTKAYEQQLQVLQQALVRLADPEAMQADLNKLALEDPAKAQQLFFKRMQIQQGFQQIQGEMQRLAQERQAETTRAKQEAARAAVETLQNDIPGWSDERYSQILKSAVKDYGFKPEEANDWTDPRLIKVLDDARQFRELKAKPIGTKQVVKTPKVVKPGGAEKPQPNEWKNDLAQLQKSGGKDEQAAIRLAMRFVA